MSRVTSTECRYCPLEGPDPDGQYDLHILPGCPVHGYDERAVIGDAELFSNPRDACKDRSAELAHDGVYLTNADVFHANHLARRHLVGLPSTGDVLPLARAKTPDAGAAPSLSPAAPAEGPSLPDLAA